MKVLTVNYECPPQGGGAGEVMLNLMRSLHSVGVGPQTALCGWDYRLGSAPAIDGIDFRFVPVKRVSTYTTGVRAVSQFLWRARRPLRAMAAEPFDLVHFHFSVPTGLLKEYVHGKPFVCSLHGIDVPGFVKEATVLQQAAATLNRRVLKGASLVFAPSSKVAELIEDYCPAAKVRVIPHGVDPDRFLVRTEYRELPIRLVTVARLLPWKRIDNLVKAVVDLRSTVPELTLDIYGDGEERTRLEAAIATAGATSYITLHGMVPREIVAQQLHRYDVFVLPSVTEAFGLVFLEAMAAGLPLLGFNSAGPAEIIEHGSTGLLFDRDNVDDLRGALARVLFTGGLAARMGQRARAVAVARYSWDVIARRYQEAFESVILQKAS